MAAKRKTPAAAEAATLPCRNEREPSPTPSHCRLLLKTMAALLCPVCSQSHFDTLESLRRGLVRAATQNIPCPICDAVLLGLDKLTIHLFGHSLTDQEVTHRQPPPPTTVNMDDLTFLTSWTNEKRPIDHNSYADTSHEHVFPQEVYLEIKPKISGHLTPEKVSKRQCNRVESDSKEVNSSPDLDLFQKSDPMLYLRHENIGKFINPHLMHKSYVPSEATAQTDSLHEQDSLQVQAIESPPSFIFDGDTGFLLAPSVSQRPSSKSPMKSPGEELSHFMAGTLYIDSMQQHSKPTIPEVLEDLESALARGYQGNSQEPSNTKYTIESESNQAESPPQQSKVRRFNLKPGHCDTNSCQDKIDIPRMPEDRDQLAVKDFANEFNRDVPGEADPFGPVADMLQNNVNTAVDEAPKEKEKVLHTCRECGKSYRMRGSLIVHLRVAHGGLGLDSANESRNFHCSICPKSFKKEQHLGQHMKTHDGKQWQCETCTKLFTTKYFLKKHQRLHTGEMPYCCETCGKAFTFQQSYHKHLLYHSSDKPHDCKQCGRAFKELSTLHNHQRIHSGEKPFACETCGKCFRQRVSYIVHQRIHTGVLPYQCTACHKKFRYKVSQRSHKCTMQPPGIVVKQPGDLIQRLLQHRNVLPCHQ